jgi:hypothetical protein
MIHTCNPSYMGGRDWKDCSLKPAQADRSQDPISEIPNTKQGSSGVAHVTECLPSKHEALNSNPSTAKGEKKKKVS